MYEAERQRGRLAHRNREQVGEDASERHGGREPRDDGRARDGGRECGRGGACDPLKARRNQSREATRQRRGEREQPRRGPRRQREGQVERDERVGDGHCREREPEGSRPVGATPERPGPERRGGHPRCPDRRPTCAGQLGVEPRRRHADGRREPARVDARRDALDAHEHQLEELDHEREDEHQVHPRDGEQVGEPGRAERAIVFRGQVTLAQDQSARHRREIRRERRVDPRAHCCPRTVDPGEQPRGPPHHAHVERPPRADDAPVRLAGSRIAAGFVPQALRLAQRGDDVDLVAAREVFGASVQRRGATPRDRLLLAGDVGQVGVPAKHLAHSDGRRSDVGASRAALRQTHRSVGGGAFGFVRRHRHRRPHDPDERAHGTQEHEPPARASRDHREAGGHREGHRNLARSGQSQAPCDEGRADEDGRIGRVDGLAHAPAGQHRACRGSRPVFLGMAEPKGLSGTPPTVSVDGALLPAAACVAPVRSIRLL